MDFWDVIDAVIVIYAAAVLSVWMHECGHALFQRLFGITVKKVQLGCGPMLFKFGVFQLHAAFLGGSVAPNGAKMAASRWQAAVIAAGGAISQWFGVGILTILGMHTLQAFENFYLVFIIYAFMGLIQAFIPIQRWDGYYFWKAMRGE